MDLSYLTVLLSNFKAKRIKIKWERIIYVIVIKDIINQLLKRVSPLRYTILYNREVMQHLPDEIFSISKGGCSMLRPSDWPY